ncbi:LacI family DNA-binding transcriptional regulator [Sinomonas sp. ASV322]|uniref:LacI family DNA-binding transcriptional regulator n=1 Tax=Sinomonas sp. ASV322 TaxID=3041920 RepID=UPI0027DB5995|nr:LacI family DNA-binding transcriptional regulator [Sinomonas sp. ASV322]MDQ4504144.1 LacI family DNA-binding transcriptional regulator [Sinomonas sp. ASV322]
MTTIADIARAAGVSKSTVSRSFSRPGSVNDETRDRILAVASGLGYTPAPVRAASTGTIALFVPDIANPYYPPLVKAIQSACRRQSLSLLVIDGEDDPEADADELDRIIGRVDGAIVFAPRMDAERLRALDAVAPVVLINHVAEGLPSVVLSAPEGARQAVEHLVALGHRSIAYLASREDNYSSKVRLASAEEAAAELGCTLKVLAHAEPTYAAGVRGADLVLAESVTAVIAHNDLMALGCLNRLVDRGVTVGEGVSVVGFDNIWLASASRPTLTTVDTPFERGGAVALRLLTERISEPGRPATAVHLSGDLIVRGSTAPAPALVG